MPPRRSTGRTASGQQSTLSFTNSRVTKPSASAAGKQIKDTEPIAKELIEKATSNNVVPVVESPDPSSVAADIIEPEVVGKDELDEPQADEDRQALKVTEAAIKKYWAEEERGRSAPRGG